MTEVYLIRHSIKMRGPVKGDFRVYDRMQPLSGEGEERAKQLLELPELRGAGFAAASTMSRSLATIRYLLEADDVPFAIDDRLRELDFGIKPEGMPMDEFMGRRWEHPEEVPQGGGSHGAAIGAYLSGVIDCVDDDFVRNINLPDVFRLCFDGETAASCDRLEMPFPVPVRGKA